jgi:hypothetical protein
VGRGADTRRARAGHTLQRQGGLAREDLQNLAFEATITQRHTAEVILVNDHGLCFARRHGQHG